MKPKNGRPMSIYENLWFIVFLQKRCILRCSLYKLNVDE